MIDITSSLLIPIFKEEVPNGLVTICLGVGGGRVSQPKMLKNTADIKNKKISFFIFRPLSDKETLITLKKSFRCFSYIFEARVNKQFIVMSANY